MKRPPLPRNVIVVSWVSFFQDAASDLLYPVLPLFIVGVLGAPPIVLGLIEGVAEGTASVLKAVSGRLADRMRRKPLIFFGYGLSGVSKPLMGLAGLGSVTAAIGVLGGWPLVLASRFADRVGKGIRTSPRDALIADDTPPEMRGRAFGFHRAADSAGAVLGPLLGLMFFLLLGHKIRPLFFIAFVPALVSVSLIGFIKDTRGAVPAKPQGDKSYADLGSDFWKVLAFVGAFGLFNFSDTFLLLRARELHFSFISVILVYAAFNVTYSLLSYPAGSLADRVPKRLVFGAGLLVFAAAYIALGLITTAAWVWVLLPLYGCYSALTDGVGKAWVAGMLPSDKRGSGIGLFHGVYGGSVLIASLWAGAFWGHTGRGPLLVSGVAAFAIGTVMLLSRRFLTMKTAAV